MFDTLVNDVKKLETDFVNSLGSGRAAVKYLYVMCVHAAQSRDTTVLTNAAKRAKNKGDDAAFRIVNKSLAALFPKGEATETGYKLNKSQHEQLFLEKLEKAVEDKLSIRGVKFAKDVFDRPVKEYVLADAAAAFVAKAVKQGHSKDAAIAAVKAVEVK